MSRLNATIKLFFCLGELFFVLISFVFVLVSGLVSAGQVAALTDPAARRMATWVLLLSGAVFICTGFGCAGALRQTLRKGCFAGRRMLCLHQLLLLLVLVFSVSQYEWLNKRENSVGLVVADPAAYPRYDSFERRVSTYFNNAYFDSLCSDDRSSAWLLDWVDNRCPTTARMGRDDCSSCDTSCTAASLDVMQCCPSETLCDEGNTGSCPYHRCRVEILAELYAWVAPLKAISQIICFLSVLMLILSCLLICFNPRDEIEIELLKTGVMSPDDIEAIRRLKENANAVTKRGSKIDVEMLNPVKEQQPKSTFGYSRKRLTRVSPTNIVA